MKTLDWVLLLTAIANMTTAIGNMLNTAAKSKKKKKGTKRRGPRKR
ncbi:hypothetical protein QP794_28100 [Paenibacillus sp. UMB7766-LJ446]|nr:hypothetical protein [Paenibacillus sp. UMB7766-LJ446]MDK8193950.1 hypothetical protein [Paenibacillus sp. UMB7766-LJ446]